MTDTEQARQQAVAQVESIEEMIEALHEAQEDGEAKLYDTMLDEEGVLEVVQEDPLSVEVRSGWYIPGSEEGNKPSEFNILLCTGGPAVRLIGDLDTYGEPDHVRVQYQDWGTPWVELFSISDDQRAALLEYCQNFYFSD